MSSSNTDLCETCATFFVGDGIEGAFTACKIANCQTMNADSNTELCQACESEFEGVGDAGLYTACETPGIA